MGFVVSLTHFTPAPRYDSVPWNRARLEESAEFEGPYLPIETFNLSPLDVDPEEPQSRDFTSTEATLESGWYRIVWLDASDNEDPSGAVYSPAVGVLYATAGDVRNYVAPKEIGLSDPDLELVLQQAQRDVDSVLGAYVVSETTGLKLDPSTLTDSQRERLRRATCAQVQYRLEMGADFFSKGQHEFVGGPEFSVRGTLPYIAPRVDIELDGSGLDRLVEVG